HGPQDFLYTGALKQFFALSDDWSVYFGLSYANGPNSTAKGNRTDVFGADLYLKFRPITYGSYTIVSLQSEGFVLRPQGLDATQLSDVDMYAYRFWRFDRRWGTAARYEYGSRTFGDVADDLDPYWTGARHRVSANLTFWPTEFSRLRLQGSVDAPSWLDKPTLAAMLAFEVVVRTHRAHHLYS